MADRRKVRNVRIGNLLMGEEQPVYIQSMTFTKTSDRDATLSQIKRLEESGCEIVRFSVPDEESAKNIPYFKEHTSVPLVADIHFDYRLALKSAEYGIDKIRINPGNIGSDEHVKAVADMCRSKKIPIRIGVNGGSLEKHILAKYGCVCPRALCESALYHTRLLEKFDFYDTVVSIKASDVKDMIEANRLFASETDYPLHLGVTEAGTERMGIIKSSVGIGSLLCDGIGDTIRVSLTEDVVKEVEAARDLLKALGLRSGANVVSCPTCSRCNIDVMGIAAKVGEYLKNTECDIKVAVMGCAVNGPGEARDADIGIAGGNGEGLLFKKGDIYKKVPQELLLDTLMNEVDMILTEKRKIN